MEENSKVYRIRTKVGEDSPNVIHVPINQTYDTFEILSLKLNQTDTYKTYESGYGIIVGRVIANGGFGVPNSKVSVFIEVDDNESLKDTLLYNFTSTSDTDNDGVRYNLLPDYVEAECHQDVGTFPNKRLVLDNDDVIEIFDKYWKYTTTTNNSGDYMLFGIPTGSQQLHVDIDLSDCGVLSQRPHNMIGKGYDIGMFESPNKFKSSTNLNSLPQIVTEDRGVYVYPYWGDTSNGDNTFAITRCDINIEYKFEPTAVFMGSIITDKGSNAIGKNCTATINNGKMSELVTGEGTIEMIRKTIDGRVEQFPIMGNRLIDGDGTWVYEIPMNLDYVTTDEFGNFVPTDNPDKGIATRARVRFRVRLDDTQYDNTARKRACYLIPNNPRLEDEGFDKTMEVDYEFGSLTREESYRDLFWNKVYTVKSYIPKIQKGDEQYNRQHTGIKWVNHANQNNPMPYNTLTVKLSFVHRIICILTNLVVQFVAFINQIISLLGFLFATLFDLPSVIFNGLARLLEDTICLPWPLSDVCVGDLLAQIFYGIGKGLSSINILGRMATKFLTPKCIVLDSGFCDDNVNKIDFYPGCGYFLFNLFPLSSATDVVERGDIAWEKTQEAQQEEYNGKSSDEVRTASNHTGELHNCYENALAQENEATSFNFNNDWINGTLYAPLWYRKITPKKRFFFGLFSRKAKDEWCTSKQYFPSLRYIQHCAVERDGSKTITNFDGDTTDMKFIRNSECDNGDCHERHVALPGLGGVIHSKKTMLGQDVYYYKPVEWSANLPSNELYRGKKKGELKLLFATDIVLLGSLDSCDMNGIPQFFKNLESTTYNMPGDILFTDYEFHYIIDPETGDATSNYNTQDYTVHSEMAGCDWGNPNEFNRGDGGLFYGIGCTNGETELYAKSCVNLSRICEYGVSLDVTKQIPLLEKWKDETTESEIEQAEDGTYYKRLITDGYISWDELYNLDERSMFATMNGNQLKTKINTKNGLKEYDFRYLYPENFDGSLAERMKRRTQNYPPEVNYKFNYLLEKASRDYYLFRMGNKPYYYDSNNAFPRYENSFYFYFGLNEGKTAIEKFNSKYFAECDNEKGVYNNFNIYKKSSSWCSSLNNTYDGFIALDLEKIATPYSIVITGDDTFTLDDIRDEKIIFYNYKIYSIPEGFEDYSSKKFEEFEEVEDEYKNIFIPNGAYYLTITDANEEEYHYELDMSYNFLMYSNNVQSFKKNHEDLLRSLGTNNAIMNDNTKLVYSNPEKIEREIGGVITVYGVHDNDGDIEQYKIEVKEKVDFDKTDIQKTIEKEGDTWYDADGNFCEVISIEGGTIHYTKNGEEEDEEGNPYIIVGRNTVEDYDRMKKELIIPEWYDKDAKKHYLTEKDEDGNYVYEEGTQQADFKPLVNEDMEGGDTWYDNDGVKHTASSGDTVVDYTDWTLELNLPTYYNKNGVKQNYPYQPNKETSVVDFELSDRLKEVTSIKPQGEEILTVEQWNSLSTEEKTLYEEVYVNKTDETDIRSKEQWEALESEVERANYVKMYRNKYTIIHYTKNGEGDYRGRATWYDADGVEYTASSSDIGETVMDYSDWVLELTPPTWYDLDGYFCEVTSVVPQGKEVISVDEWSALTSTKQGWYAEVYVNRNDETDIRSKEQWEALEPDEQTNYTKMYRNKINIIHYTKNGEGDNTIVDFTISDRNTVTEVTFNSSLENAPYLEYLYNLYKGDTYVEKKLLGVDYVEYGISYKVISPYALTTDEYDKLTEFGKFDYEPNYINKIDSSVITIDDYNKLPDDYGQKSYDVYNYINKDDSNVIDVDTYNQLPDYNQDCYEEVYVNKTDETDIRSKEQWETLDPDEKDNYEKKYKNKYDDDIIDPDEWAELSTEYCKHDYEVHQYVNKTDSSIITKNAWEGLRNSYGKRDYEVHEYVNKQDSSKITIDAYNQLSDGYGQNRYKEEPAYCKIENKIEYITKKEYDDNVNIQFLYQQFHVLNENENILIENGYKENLVKKGYNSIIVNYEKLTKELVTGESSIEFSTKDRKDKKTVTKGSNGWCYKTENIEGNYIITYDSFLTPLEDGDYYYTYEGIRKPYIDETPIVNNDNNELDFTSLVRVLSFETWLDEDGALCEVTSVDTDGTIHYTKNGEGDYTIVGRNTVINYNQPIWTKTTRSDDNYSWVDKNGVTQYAGAEKIVVDYSWLLETTTQEEIVWYDKEGNAYKVTEIEGIIIHYTKNGEGDYKDKKIGDIVVDFNHDSFILTLDDIDDVWYDEDGNFCEVTSIMPPGEEVITAVEWDSLTDKKEWYEVYEYVNNTDASIIISKEKWERLSEDQRANYKPHTYVNKIIIYYTKNGEEKDEYNNPYIIVGRDNVVNYYKFMTEPLYLPTWYDADGNLYKVTSIDNDGSTIHYSINGEGDYKDKKIGDTVVDWSNYIGYEGAEITYDNGGITEIKNVLWYDSEKQSFAFGVPDENRTYVITVTQLCNVNGIVSDTNNEIKTNVFVSGVIKYKMFINGIDYEIIKNFDGHTGWNYNGTISKNKLTTNVSDLNENNPWFNVDKIYYHDYFEGKDDNKDKYPKINLKDIERFGIDKNENEQTYAIYATEIDKEDEEVGKKVNETYHGEDGKNKTVKANDVRATFVNKRNEDEVTTYNVIHFTVKNLTAADKTWYDADGVKHTASSGDIGKTVVDYSKWLITLNIIIPVETYNQLDGDSQNGYDEVYVKEDGEETIIITKEEWEHIEDSVEKNKYVKMYRKKGVKNDIKNYFKQYVNKQVPSEFISPETYNLLEDDYGQKSYDVCQYVNKQNVEVIITKEQWEDLSEVERDKYKPYTYVNKYDTTKIISSDVWDKLPKVYCKGDYTQVYLSTWYDKNGTLNYMLPSEEGQKRIDFRPLVKTIEKEGDTWYDVNSVKRVAGSDDIGQEVLDYSKENNGLTQLKEITFKTSDKTWYDKNGIKNEADSDKLGLYIDITYMTKSDDTTLFKIYNEEYIDKLVIDKLVIDKVEVDKVQLDKYANKQVSTDIITTERYNQLPDYNKDCYDEVYVNKTDERDIRSKEQWEELDPDTQINYDQKYRNKYEEDDIIDPDEWAELPTEYCKRDYIEAYTYQYEFDKYGLHNVRIYLVQKPTYGDLLSNVINFNGCSDLNTIVLPNIGITTIGSDVFNGCKSLTSIDLPDSITTIGANAFNGCEKLSSVYIPYNVTTIGANAFNGCKSLTNIVLPKNITTIGDSVFANCEKLQSVRAEMEDVTNNTVGTNAFDNTNIGLIIYVPMDKDGHIYDKSDEYNKAGWGNNVQDKVVAIELTVFNYNKVNINPSDLLDEFARNTGDNKVYYNFIDSYVASEYKAFTQVTYFKASDFVNAINNVLSRRREIADRMFNTFYMTQEGESKSFNITSNTDEMPVQPIIVYHEEEIDDVDIDYTLTTPNLVYEQINMLKNVNIPTITYKSSPFFGDGTSSDEIMITKSNNIEKKPSSTGIMNVKQKSIPLDSGNKDFPSISLSAGVKAINPSKTNISDLFEFPVIDKIESSSVSGWTKFSNIPSPNPNNIGMINMDGYVYGRHNNGVVERDGNFEIRKLGKYEINLSENLNGNVENSTKPYTYAERRVITGLTNYSIAQWCIVKLRNIVQADDVTEETLKNIWNMLFNPTNEEYDREKLLEVIDTMTVLKQTFDEDLIIYIQCDETIGVTPNKWEIDQSNKNCITNSLIQFKNFKVVDINNERQYAFTDTKKANLNIGEINENFNFDNELKLSTEIESIDVSGQSRWNIPSLTKLSFNQGEKEGGYYQLYALSDVLGFNGPYYSEEDMKQYPLYKATNNGIVHQIDKVEQETLLSYEGEIHKTNDKEKKITWLYNIRYVSPYFYSMYKFKGSNDDERVRLPGSSTNGLFIAQENFNRFEEDVFNLIWTNNYSGAPNEYFLNPKYIRHVYCVYVKGNMKMLSPLYEFAPTQLVGTCGNLETYDEGTKSVIGVKVNDYARVYFKYCDYTLGGPFKIKRKYQKTPDTYTIPEGTIKYKDEEYYYMILDKKLDDGVYTFENNMGRKNEGENFHKDHVIAKDITNLRHLTWTNGNQLKRDEFILIKWVVPESDSFRFISEQKDVEAEDFVELTTVKKVYMYRVGQKLTKLPKNNGQYKDDDKWTIQYKDGNVMKIEENIPTTGLLEWENIYPCIITKQNKNE